MACIKAERGKYNTLAGETYDVFASLKEEHTPGPVVNLDGEMANGISYLIEGRICLRCHLVYVPDVPKEPDASDPQ